MHLHISSSNMVSLIVIEIVVHFTRNGSNDDAKSISVVTLSHSPSISTTTFAICHCLPSKGRQRPNNVPVWARVRSGGAECDGVEVQ
jgi:hypothetical protein